VWMNVLYFLIFIYTFLQCFNTKFQVHAQMQVYDSNRLNSNPLYQAVSLRLHMINSFMFITFSFYLNQLIILGFIPLRQLFNSDQPK
jgi:hypothetical protein